MGAAFYFDTPACGLTPRNSRTLFVRRRHADTVRCIRHLGWRLALVRQKPDFVGPDGVNNTGIPGIHPCLSLAANHLAADDHRRVRQSSQLSQFLRHISRDASCREHCGVDAAGQPGGHSDADLSGVAKQCLADGHPVAECQFRLCGLVQADAAFALMPQVAPPVPTLTLGAIAWVVVGKFDDDYSPGPRPTRRVARHRAAGAARRRQAVACPRCRRRRALHTHTR